MGIAPGSKQPKIGKFVVDALPDIPDLRDRMYEPTLQPLKPEVQPPSSPQVLNQGREGACTGFGLAAAINQLMAGQQRAPGVSARMLYEMAKRFDEWPGERYAGSSCRGAIKGWYHMGVCAETMWKYKSNKPGKYTADIGRAAREITLGAYYRIGGCVADYHAALMETGVVYCSADVHEGWDKVKNGKIPFQPRAELAGGHAFTLVGYNADGFFVQNSWGPGWGNKGIALWTYEDWQANVYDAWVLQLARPTPQIFPGFAHSATERSTKKSDKQAPRRNEIMGHFVHLDDGKFRDKGRYFSNLVDVKETADRLAQSDKYDHLLIYAHGGLNDADACARRCFAMRDTFKANGVYPYHVMYETGFGETLKDVILGHKKDADARMQGLFDWKDRLIEFATRPIGRRMWKEMKFDGASPFKASGDGTKVLKAFQSAMPAKKIHLVGHSAGGVLVAHLLNRLLTLDPSIKVSTLSLMAPAATVALFEELMRPALKRITEATVYNLSNRLEKDDSVGGVYQKSLLYLVSRAFEDADEAPLLGMEKYSRNIKDAGVSFLYSVGDDSDKSRCASKTHGGFDEDPATMNDILSRVLGKKPKVPFTRENLEY